MKKEKYPQKLTLINLKQTFLIVLLSCTALFINSCDKTDVTLSDASINATEHITISDEILEKVTYGPEKFVRNDDDLTVYEVQMNSEDFACHQAPYVLTVVNGEEDGTYRVVSARILIDGDVIFKQKDFGKKVEQLEQAIEITPNSMLTVELAGKPGSYIYVYITGEKSTGANLVAYYPFNGNANDESCYDHDGTVIGATLTTDRFCNANSAFSFDGIDDYGELANASDVLGQNPDEWTITAWFKTSDASIRQVIISDYTQEPPSNADLNFSHNIEIRQGVIYSNVRENDNDHMIFGPSISSDSWHFVSYVVSKVSGKATLYLDGIFVNDISINIAADYVQSEILRVGHLFYRGGRKDFFKGSIDDIRYYNYALNQAEINDLYSENGWSGYCNSCEVVSNVDNPIAFYPFNGNANDESGNSLNGIENGSLGYGVDRFGNPNSSLELNGNGYIDLGADPIGDNQSITFGAWIFPTSNHYGYIIASGGQTNSTGYTIGFKNGQYYVGRQTETNKYAVGWTNGLPLYEWHFIAGSYDKSTEIFKTYLDGVFVDETRSVAASLTNLFENLIIGNSNNSYAHWFNGKIDDVRIYDFALNPCEVQDLYSENGWSGN